MMPKPLQIALVSVSIDLGAGRRGVDMGPSALRIAGLTEALQRLGHQVDELGTVTAAGPENTSLGESESRYLKEITEVCRQTRDLVARGLSQGCFPLVLGGDHSLAVGSVAAVAGHYAEKGGQVGLIWVDAHADVNTPATSPSGNVHGMALATLLGHGPPSLLELCHEQPALSAERVSVLGARAVDQGERRFLEDLGVRVFTMSEIDERGLPACADEAIARATEGTSGCYVSFDLDVTDPMVAPGVGTPVPGGLTFREAHLICEKLARCEQLIGLELVELNPVLDEANRTAQLGVGLIASALGKSIL